MKLYFDKIAESGNYFVKEIGFGNGLFKPSNGKEIPLLLSEWHTLKVFLKHTFISVMTNDNSRHFRFTNPTDEAYFILLSNEGIEINSQYYS